MHYKRQLSFLLAVALIMSMFVIYPVAATPVSLKSSQLISAAPGIAEKLEKYIQMGDKTPEGTYSMFPYPANVTIDGSDVDGASYILMAARAVVTLAEGKAISTPIVYTAITLEKDIVSCSSSNTLTKGQYLDLAERIIIYAEATGGRLPSSFNSPTDGNSNYNGRISIYSAAHALTEILEAYGIKNALPETVTFLPTDYLGDVDEPEPEPTEPEPTEPEKPVDWYAATIAAAVKVKTSMDGKVLPSNIAVGNVTVTPGQYLYLACHVTVGLNQGQTSGTLTLTAVREPENPSGSATGKVYTSDYVAMAEKIITFVHNYGQTPNYATSSSIGAVHYYDVVHMYTKILNYYSANGALPNYNTVEGWRGTVKTATVSISTSEKARVTKAVETTVAPNYGYEDMVVADWLFTDTVVARGTNGAAKLMEDYAKAGITDVYLLCKGLAGKVAWASKVPGTVRENSNRDFLKEVCDAAKPYGIRIHPWIMGSRDTNYVSKNGSSCVFYHFRVGTSNEVNQYVNLRDSGYQAYTAALVKELVSNYDIAGIHLDTIRYGALYYDWGADTRQELVRRYGITKAEYNAAVKSMCASIGYGYSINSEGYYVYGSSYSASGAEFGSVIFGSGSTDAQNGVKKIAQLRKDTVTEFVDMVRKAAGEDMIVSCAIMPETCNNAYEAALYGQSPAQLADVVDYVAIMSYSSEYTSSTSWPLELAAACSKVGCGSLVGIQVYPSEGSSDPDPNGKTIYEEAYKTRQAMQSDPLIKGYAFFRGSYLALASAKIVDKNTLDFAVIPGDDAGSTSKLVFTLQNGVTCTGITNKVGWPSGTSFTISSDKKTVTISKSGSTLLTENNYGTFRMTISGTVDPVKGVAMLRSYKGSSYTEGYGYCATMDKDHKHTYTSAVTKAATCTEEGVRTFTCECGDTYTETIAKLAHTYTGKTDETTGKITYTCSGCGDSYITDCGHTHSRVETWQKGNRTHFALCYVCKKTATESCPIGELERIEATAEREGKIVYACMGSVSLSGELSTDAFSGKGCGYSYTEMLPYIPSPDPIEDSSLRIYHSLNLANDISLNFTVLAADLEGYDMDTVYGQCCYDLYDGNQKSEEKVLTLMPVLNGKYYYFTLEGLTAVHTSTDVTFTLYGNKNGQLHYSSEDVYSIATYALSQLNKTGSNAKLKALCANLIRYGSASQIYKGYRTDNLARDKMTSEHKTYLRDLNTVTFGNTNITTTELPNPDVTWQGKALDLNTKVAVLYVINTEKYADDPMALTLRLTYRNREGKESTVTLDHPEPYGNKANQYVFRFDSLSAAELRTTVKARVYKGSEPVSNILIYSPDTYGNGRTGQLLTLCKTLFAYSDSARDYFASST
ncbi:MAG: family 10 glycosylhydrolase [Oscillospiraceae bacterium]|nr:family 10 glycosylhydrolase [Oscillospiraceae bacterium]